MGTKIGELLKATSNVIELKPDHTYIFVFDVQKINFEEIVEFTKLIPDHIKGITVAIEGENGLQVIEKSNDANTTKT